MIRMSQEKKTTTIRVEKATKVRLEKLGNMRDTTDGVLRKLLRETWFMPKLKKTLTKAIDLNEKAKKRAGSPLSGEACDLLIKVLTEFVEEVEAR